MIPAHENSTETAQKQHRNLPKPCYYMYYCILIGSLAEDEPELPLVGLLEHAMQAFERVDVGALHTQQNNVTPEGLLQRG